MVINKSSCNKRNLSRLACSPIDHRIQKLRDKTQKNNKEISELRERLQATKQSSREKFMQDTPPI
ncbi:chaperonin cofactor prefoldin [Fontibacillus solani]|uniref:Chaperonin cofactor prefoldin n=1 Tax=Fontibacillus solani TaxID=1572857 RepID=A0A7W3SUQ6_9BACL|nr:hypothetical protein [Fontibacillus solani]MBA9086500.1 chaperonin cofactor prefoldin [Fontibacillus solani]